MAEENPYKSPSGINSAESPPQAIPRSARLRLYRDIAVTTVIQLALVVLLSPPDGGRFLNWAIPFVALGNVLFGTLYVFSRERSKDPRGEPILILVIAGLMIFSMAMWMAAWMGSVDFSALWNMWMR